MIISIIILTVFVILVLEIPFSFFVNLSLDRVLLEYEIISLIKTRGYAYVKNGELFTGRQIGGSGGGEDFSQLADFFFRRIIVKSCHVRGIFGEEDIEDTLLQSVVFQNVSSMVLSVALKNNPTADVSQSYFIDKDEDSNLFLQATLWLSVADLLSAIIWLAYQKCFSMKR